jgi:hypothetical protein
MHLHTHWVSWRERAASFAVASCVTVGATLLVFAALGPTFVRQPASGPAANVRHVAERVEFLNPREPLASVPLTRQVRRPPTRASAQLNDDLNAREAVTASPPDSGAHARRIAEPSANATLTSTSEAPARPASTASALAGAPRASVTVGFTRESTPVRFDSVLRVMTDSVGIGLLAGAIKVPPPTQAERDAKWRDEAFEVVAARGAGRPFVRKIIGGGIPIGLPFGGPSRKERERNRAIEAELTVMRAQRRARIDSISGRASAARRLRRACRAAQRRLVVLTRSRP